MKKLIYIDNDNAERAKKDFIDGAKGILKYYGGLPDDYVNEVDIIPEFGLLPRDEACEILFSKDNCICSFSMYTANHYGSLHQLIRFLTAAGSNRIVDMVYIDCSRKIEEALESELPNIKEPFELLNAIETNYIISFDLEQDLCYRLRLDFKGVDESPFKREKINLLSLLS